MKYCCDKFEKHTGTHNVGFEKPDGKWHLNGCCGGGCYVLEDIKFCPFCGKDIDPRFEVVKCDSIGSLHWRVRDNLRDATVAFFYNKAQAEQHVQLIEAIRS